MQSMERFEKIGCTVFLCILFVITPLLFGRDLSEQKGATNRTPSDGVTRWAIGSDHRGFAYKEGIKQAVADVVWHDVGPYDEQRSDYPRFADALCKEIVSGRVQAGVLICSSGVGMTIAANHHKGIYAGLAWNEEVARRSKEHTNTNVLVIPADFVSLEQAIAMIKAWSDAQFLGGRYRERIEMIDAMTTG